MLPGKRAFQLQHQIEGGVEAGHCARHLLLIVRIGKQVNVDIAVARVTKIDDADVVFVRKLLQSVNQIGNTRDRYDNILVDLLGCYVAQCGRE